MKRVNKEQKISNLDIIGRHTQKYHLMMVMVLSFFVARGYFKYQQGDRFADVL